MPIQPSPAVLRACDVLDHLAAAPGEARTVTEIARDLAMSRATCDAVLLALADRGLVERSEDRRYALGAACVGIGDAARAAGVAVAAVAGIADDLARELGACVAVVRRHRDEVRVEEVRDHGPVFGVRARAGEAIPLLAPFGAVFVAWAGDAEVAAWLGRGRSAAAADERDRHVAALALIRRLGCALSVATPRVDLLTVLEDLVDDPSPERLRARDDLIREMAQADYLPVGLDPTAPARVTQISAPVFDHTGRVALAVMVLGPAADLAPAEVGSLVDRVRAAGSRATDRIGGHAP